VLQFAAALAFRENGNALQNLAEGDYAEMQLVIIGIVEP
jgi:hypothetical protein